MSAQHSHRLMRLKENHKIQVVTYIQYGTLSIIVAECCY